MAIISPKKLAPDPSCQTRKPETWNLFLSASGLRLAAASLPDLFSTGEALYSEIKFLCFLRPHFMDLRWGGCNGQVLDTTGNCWGPTRHSKPTGSCWVPRLCVAICSGFLLGSCWFPRLCVAICSGFLLGSCWVPHGCRSVVLSCSLSISPLLS